MLQQEVCYESVGCIVRVGGVPSRGIPGVEVLRFAIDLGVKLLRWLWTFSPVRWLVNGFLAAWIRLLPGELARTLVGLVGPAIRGLGLTVSELTAVLSLVSTKLKGTTPTYIAIGQYVPADVEYIVTGICNSLNPLLTDRGIVLTDVQYATMAEALAVKLAARYPVAA